MYFVLLCATVVGDAAAEMCETCGTPTLRVCFLLSANTEHYSKGSSPLFKAKGRANISNLLKMLCFS